MQLPIQPDESHIAVDQAAESRCICIRPGVDRLAQGEIDRRLTVFGGDDDQRVLENMRRFQRIDKGAELGIDEGQPELQTIVGMEANGVGVTANETGGFRIFQIPLGELLSDAHRLKVHAENRRNGGKLRAGAVLPACTFKRSLRSTLWKAHIAPAGGCHRGKCGNGAGASCLKIEGLATSLQTGVSHPGE